MDAVVVEVWWGLVEGRGPHCYTWSAYEAMFDMLSAVGLKVRVCCFGLPPTYFTSAPGWIHVCGSSLFLYHDSVTVVLQVHLCFHGNGGYSLPAWILEIGTENPDIFFSDRQHDHSLDCLSIGIDEGMVYVAAFVITTIVQHVWLTLWQDSYAHELVSWCLSILIFGSLGNTYYFSLAVQCLCSVVEQRYNATSISCTASIIDSGTFTATQIV